MTLRNILSAYEMYEQDVIASAKASVLEGGGVYVGIQEGGKYADLVLFNSPTTGTTLVLPTSEISPNLVRDKIAASDKLFARKK